MSTENEAVWFKESKARGEVGPAPFPECGPDDVLLRIRSVAINPAEAIIQSQGILLTAFPAVVGSDGAGEVHSVGSNVKDFAPGDRVMGAFGGAMTAQYTHVSFQRYAATKSSIVCKIPSSVSYNDAVVLPLTISSAADALFHETGMGLSWPQLTETPKPTGKTVVVWGGSSSIGTSATQMLVSAGYTVAAVAGSRNQDLCKSVGATHVFDYSSPTVIEDIAKQLAGSDIAGLLAAVVSKDCIEKAAEVFIKLGSKGKLGSLQPSILPPPCEVPEGVTLQGGMLPRVLLFLERPGSSMMANHSVVLDRSQWRLHLWQRARDVHLEQVAPLCVEQGPHQVRADSGRVRKGIGQGAGRHRSLSRGRVGAEDCCRGRVNG